MMINTAMETLVFLQIISILAILSNANGQPGFASCAPTCRPISIWKNATLNLDWKITLSKTDILWCYFQHAVNAQSGWDQFLGYHYDKNERQNISSDQIGWVFINKSAPCQGGMRKDKATPGMGGQYQMVIIARNNTQYKSGEIQVVVSYCTKPEEIENTNAVLTLAGSSASLATYTCSGGSNFTDGDPVKEISCLETGSWNDTIPSCISEESGESTCEGVSIWTLVLVSLICFSVPAVIAFVLVIVFCNRKKYNVNSKNHKDLEKGDIRQSTGNENIHLLDIVPTLPDEQKFAFIETFGDLVILNEEIQLKVLVKSPTKPIATWYRDNVIFRPDESIKMVAIKEKNHYTFTLTIDEPKSGKYKCVVKNRGKEIIHEKEITVVEEMQLPEFETDLPETIEVDIDDPVAYNINIKGSPVPNYICLKDNKELDLGDGIHFNEEVKLDIIHLTLKFDPDKCTLGECGSLTIKAENKKGKGKVELTRSYIIQKKPTILRAFKNECIQKNIQAVFDFEVSAYPPPKIAWFLNDEKHVGGISFTNTNGCKYVSSANYETKKVGQYNILATSSNQIGEEKCAAVLYVVDEEVKPGVTVSSKVVTVKVGSQAKLVANIKGNPEPTVTWLTNPGLQKQGTINTSSGLLWFLSEGLQSTCTIDNCQLTDSCDVIVKVESPVDGKYASEVIKLRVIEKPRILSFSEKVAAVVGEDAVVYIKASGSPVPSIIWDPPRQMENDRLENKDEPDGGKLIIRNVKKSGRWKIIVTVKNEAGEEKRGISLIVTDTAAVSGMSNNNTDTKRNSSADSNTERQEVDDSSGSSVDKVNKLHMTDPRKDDDKNDGTNVHNGQNDDTDVNIVNSARQSVTEGHTDTL